MSRKCETKGCNQPATWAVQWIAGEFSATAFGSHYRGFKMHPMCDACKEYYRKETKRANKEATQ